MTKDSLPENDTGPDAAQPESTQPESTHKVTFFTIIKSVLAAMVGIQSSKNRERDFRHGKPIHFIVAGLIAVALFILLLVGLVRFAMSLAG